MNTVPSTYSVGDTQAQSSDDQTFWRSPVMIWDSRAVVVGIVAPASTNENASVWAGQLECALDHRVADADWLSCRLLESTGGGTVGEAQCTAVFEAPPEGASTLRIRMVIGDAHWDSVIAC